MFTGGSQQNAASQQISPETAQQNMAYSMAMQHQMASLLSALQQQQQQQIVACNSNVPMGSPARLPAVNSTVSYAPTGIFKIIFGIS